MNDIKYGSETDAHQELACRQWIGENIKPIKNINRGASSYRLKHFVEAANAKTYITNEAFISAADQLGYKVRRVGPNAYFNMSFTKLKLK